MATGKDVPASFLLYGKMGNGMSATGNSILGKRVFGSQGLVVESSEFKDRQILVVDGLSVDTKLDAQDVQELHQVASEAVEKYGPFHAIIIVLKYGTRFTDADKNIFRALKLTFGKNVVSKHGVVVLTNGDVFEADQDNAEEQGRGRITFEQWCSQQTGLFRDIVEECKDRIVLFNNREKNEKKKILQVEEFLKLVDSMKVLGYSIDDFAKADEHRKVQMLEAQEPGIRENVKQKVAEVKTQLENIKRLEPRSQTSALHTLLSEVEQFSQWLENNYRLHDPELRNQGKQVLRGCVQQVSMLKSEIRGNLEMAQATRSSYQLGAGAAGRPNTNQQTVFGRLKDMIRGREHYVYIAIVILQWVVGALIVTLAN